MKKTSFLFLLLLFWLSTAASWANNLYVNKIFSTTEDCTVSYSDDYYYYRNKTSNQKAYQYTLYKVKDIDKALANNQINNQYVSLRIDSLDEKLIQLIKKNTWLVQANQYSSTLNLGKLPSGMYIISLTGYGKTSVVPFFVSDYDLLTVTHPKGASGFVSKRNASKMIKIDQVSIIENGQQKHLPLIENGYAFALDNSSVNSTAYLPIYAKIGEQFAFSRSYIYGKNNVQQASTALIYTDRSAYRPDQKVFFKAIVRIPKEEGGFSVPTDSITYAIFSPDHKQMLKKTVKLDQYGCFSDSLMLAKDAPLGNYKIAAQMGSVSGQMYYYNYYYGTQMSCDFSVEEYKKPEYEVLITSNQGQYAKDETAKIEVEARYFFGTPVTNAQVEYSVVREEYFTPWWYRYEYYWWYEECYGSRYYGRGKQTVIQSKTTVDALGKATIEVPIKDPSKETNYKYYVYATVTDASRRAITNVVSFISAAADFNLTAFSERYYVKQNENIQIFGVAKDFSNKPIQTKLTAKFYDRTYDTKLTKSRNDLVKEMTILTDALNGEATFNFVPQNKGYYTVIITGTDQKGREISTSTSFYVMGDDQDHSWFRHSNQKNIFTDKEIYAAGETIKAIVLVNKDTDGLIIASNDKQIYMNKVFRNNATSDFQFVDIAVPTSTDAFGKQRIAFYYSNKSGSMTSYYTEVTITPVNKYLQVELLFDKETYKPGTKATATVIVKDERGNPVPYANVSLATADESIYSMYADKTKDIRTVFYNATKPPIQPYSYTYNNVYGYPQKESIAKMVSIIRADQQNFSAKEHLFQNDKQVDFHILHKAKTPTLRGFVYDKNGLPAANAEIVWENKTFSCNKEGEFLIEKIDKAYVDLSINYQKESTRVRNIPLRAKSETQIAVMLSKKDIFVLPEHSVVLDSTNLLINEAGDDDIALEAKPIMEEALQGTVAGVTVNTDRVTSASPKKESAQRDAKGASFKSEDSPGGTDDEQQPAFVDAVVRKDFKDAIYWNPTVVTDGQGKATVLISLPDNLTTWRTNVKVVTLDTKVGQAMAKVIVTKNLLVRMETPRFFTQGDQVYIATNIHNYLSQAKDVKVSLLSDEFVVKGTEKIIRVEAKGEQRIDWVVDAKELRNGKLKVSALTDEESDAAQLEVPVQPNGIDMVEGNFIFVRDSQSKTLEINLSSDASLDAAVLQISPATSVASALLAAMPDLIGYPYGCVEQTMSRFLPNVIVANTLIDQSSQYASSIDKAELEKMVQAGVKRLGELQQTDGSWGWWSNDNGSPYYTSYVMYGLTLAKTAGYKIDENSYATGLNALRNQLAASGSKADKTTFAYLVMVSQMAGLNAWKADYAKEKFDNAYHAALLLQAAMLAKDKSSAQKIAEYLRQNASKSNNMVSWQGKAYSYSWRDDNVETTAAVVKGLAMYDDQDDLIPGAASYLLSKRRGASWHNTRQTAMSIFGLSEIIKKEMQADYSAEIFLNGTLIKTLRVSPLSAPNTTPVSITASELLAGKDERFAENLLKNGKNALEVKMKGKGVLYVNTKLTYFLTAKQTSKINELRENGSFKVERQYFKLVLKQDKKGFHYDKVLISEADALKSGQDIMVKVKVNSKMAQEHVLIEDFIPAGCEFIQDPKPYIIRGEADFDGTDRWNSRRGYWYNWYTNRENRDNRLALMITYLNAGDYEYNYLLKTQIPGQFNVRPTLVQLMYYPEIRGFSQFTTMKITE